MATKSLIDRFNVARTSTTGSIKSIAFAGGKVFTAHQDYRGKTLCELPSIGTPLHFADKSAHRSVPANLSACRGVPTDFSAFHMASNAMTAPAPKQYNASWRSSSGRAIPAIIAAFRRTMLSAEEGRSIGGFGFWRRHQRWRGQGAGYGGRGDSIGDRMETKMPGRGTEGRRSDAVPEGRTESTNHHPDLKEIMNCISEEKPAEFTIYKVHEHVRSISVKAYEPELISIGPYHRHKENLMMMEGHKYRYLHSLLQVDKDLEMLRSAIKAKAPEARKCYAEDVKLSEDDFVDMLMLDGCFIIVLVQKYKKYSEKDPAVMQSNDPIFSMEWIMESLQRDLILFENQVPFFVLRDLFKLITNDKEQKQLELEKLLVKFFESLFYGRDVLTGPVPNQLPRHLLELIHQSFTSLWYDLPEKEENDEKPKRKGMAMINTASQLSGANVRFERDDQLPLLNFKFKNGTIKMAKLTIEYRTESIYRNLIAYELYFCQGTATATNLVTDYVKLLDNLVSSSKDVEILSKYGIIENWLGDDEVVAIMFNRLTESGPGKSSRYEKVFNDINRHYSNRTNKWMAKLKANYLNSPWTVISVAGGIFLLLLTATQTVCSVLQVLKP